MSLGMAKVRTWSANGNPVIALSKATRKLTDARKRLYDGGLARALITDHDDDWKADIAQLGIRKKIFDILYRLDEHFDICAKQVQSLI
jgi:hypothetical protein